LECLQNNIKDERVLVLELDADNIPKSEYGQYDAVIMLALIEHLIDPLGAMKSIKKLLKPGGFVYIDTPNIAKFTQRAKLLLGRFPSTASQNEGLATWDGKPVHLYDEGHLHYFTFRSLSLMLTQCCGFSKICKAPYTGGFILLNRKLHFFLAKAWPELFSELAVIAY
jgi:SAM-dependent methyltransferase